jgi:Fur family transcriptional regulator, ferric uptake regulator
MPEPASKAVSPIERKCREAGLRLTGPRRLIARVLDESHDHPDVPELHRRVAARDDKVSLATVYRAVKRFEEAGIIERHAFRDGRARYETAQNRHHDHLIDLESGRVVEFRSEEIERLQAEIADRLGYKLVGHRLELYAVPASKPKTPGSRGDRKAPSPLGSRLATGRKQTSAPRRAGSSRRHSRGSEDA